MSHQSLKYAAGQMHLEDLHREAALQRLAAQARANGRAAAFAKRIVATLGVRPVHVSLVPASSRPAPHH